MNLRVVGSLHDRRGEVGSASSSDPIERTVLGGGPVRDRGRSAGSGGRMAQGRAGGRRRGLDRLLAADFLGIGPRGFVLNKEAWLGRHASGDFKYLSMEQQDPILRKYTDSAILLVTEESKSTYKGQPVSVGALRATYTFVRLRGSWRLAGAQYSPIQGAP